MISIFSYLLFGQILDNMPINQQKSIFCCIELLLTCWFSVMGGVYLVMSRSDSQAKINSIIDQFVLVSCFLTSALQILMTIQLFNWFSKRKLGTVIGVWLFFEGLGLMAKFRILNIYSYFPNFKNAWSKSPYPYGPCSPNPILEQYAFFQFVISCLLLLFTIFDWVFFVFHPFELNIVIDVQEKRD